MRFSQDFIEKVQEASNIVDVISQYTQLKPSSGGFMGRCPFPDHPEKTPSFSVSENKQVYYCFGCHKRGNIFTFLQQFNGMNFPEAIEFLAHRAHIPLPEPEGFVEKDGQRETKKLLLKVNSMALQFFQDQFRTLPADHYAKKYARESRGLTEETIKDFKIGFATAEWDALVTHLSQKNIALPLAEELKLIRPRKEGKSGFYDLFRDRLMFPITNTLGEVLAFGGRILQDGEPKYLNSPESPVFYKSKALYGLEQTAKYIRSEDQVIIVEGYMDLISLYQKGIRNLAATMGTALTPDHGRLIRRMTKNVVVLFDGDQAGIDAAERSLPILLEAGTYPRGLILPEKLDPDEFIQQYGVDNLKKQIQQAPDLFDLILNRWTQGFRGEVPQKIQLIDRMKPVFASMKDSRQIDLYLHTIAEKLSVTKEWAKQALESPQANIAPKMSKQIGTPVQKIDNGLSPTQIILKGSSRSEQLLLGLILNNYSYFSSFIQLGGLKYILHDGVKNLIEKSHEYYRQGPEKFDKLASLLTSYVDLPELLIMPKEVSHVVDEEADQKLLNDCMRRMKEQFLKQEADRLAQELKISPSQEKLEMLMQIQRDRLSINKD